MKSAIAVMLTLAAAAMAAGQQAPPPDRKNVEVIREIRVEGSAALGAPGQDVVRFVSAEFTWDGNPVKNAPYSAESVTETTQTLADGNRIVNKTSAQVYRDSEGRTRREENLGVAGPWAAAKAHKMVFINDPVAKVNYVVDPDSRTVRKMTLRALSYQGGSASAVAGVALPPPPPALEGGAPMVGVFNIAVPPPGGPPPEQGSAQYRNEPLGKQNIEGVLADGTRSVTTIPAGAMGNERAIEIVSERWYSAELQTVVLSKHSDPRFGSTVYRLASIQRAEPPAHLFQPPSDFEMKEDKADSFDVKVVNE